MDANASVALTKTERMIWISGSTFTMGSGTPSACTVTFAKAFTTNAPSCISNWTGGVSRVSTVSTTAFTVTLTSPPASGAVVNYHCIGTE